MSHFRYNLPLLLLCFLAASCLDQETTTVVNSDGTCQRKIIVASTDSPFPLHFDASWDTSRTVAGTESDSVKLLLQKTFPSFEALEQEYAQSGDSAHFGVRISVEKSFRWFYSYYDYKETYTRFTRDTLVPPESILTSEEMTRFTYGDTSHVLSGKVEDWHNRNLYEILFRHVKVAAEQTSDVAALAALDAHKDEFYAALFKNMSTVPQIVQKDGSINPAGLDSLVSLARRTFQVAISREVRTAFGEGVQRAFHHTFSPESKVGWSFVNIVTLPGMIIQTTAPDSKGSTATWKLDVDRLSFINYVMTAESREVNVWAMVVTGLGLLAVVGWLVIGRTHPRSSLPNSTPVPFS